MRAVTATIVVAALLLALVLGLSRGFDTTSGAILVASALVGAVAIAAANRSSSGVTRPAACEDCGGVISPHAPFCKHCGARRTT